MTKTERTRFTAWTLPTIFFGAISFLAASSTAIHIQEQKLAHAGKGPDGNKNVSELGRQTSVPHGSPLTFIENMGQTAEQVRFVSHGSGYALFLTQQDAVLTLNPGRRLDSSPARRAAFFRNRRIMRRNSKPSVLRVHLVNSNAGTTIAGEERSSARVDYFLGSDPTRWRTNVPSFARVRYANVYPGVDLVFYGNRRHLEYDFVVAPGADPNAIALSLEGSQDLRVDERGDLLVGVSNGVVKFQKPVVYQESQGERHEIASGYKLTADHRVTFSVDHYDSNAPLIVDPVLAYSTYLGGDSDDSGAAIAVDAQGNSVVVGSTLSLQFPTTANAFTPTPLTANANGVVFVTKLNPTGTQQLYSSYLGGSGGDFGFAVALDPIGNIFVTGETDSADFPTTANALKPGPNAGNTNGTSFVFKINPALSGAASLLYSSYLGGTQSAITEFGNGIATDSAGLVYVVGVTGSQPGATLADFPITATTAFQATPGTGIVSGTGFLSKLDATQTGSASLLYSTYLGGNGANASGPGFGDSAFAVAEDAAGKTYVAGTTTSTNFPTTPNAFQQSAPAAIAQGTVFLSSFDTTLTGAASLLYSSYLGGEATDFGDAIALGPSNVAYLTGSTSSLLFPTTPGAFQTTGKAASVAFVSLIDTSLSGPASLKYSSFLGGSQTNTAAGIAADSAGNAYVVGSAHGADFPTTPFAIQISPESGASGAGFVTKLSPAGKGAADLIYSTYFGGSGANGTADEINGVALNSVNHAVIAGDAVSAIGFPLTPGAFQSTLSGSSDAFVAELTFEPAFSVSPSSLAFGSIRAGLPSSPKTVALTSNSILPISFDSAVVSNGVPDSANADFVATTTCGQSIAASAACTITVVFTPSINGPESANLVVTDGASANPQTVALTGTGSVPLNFALTTLPPVASLTLAQGASGSFSVEVTPDVGFNQNVALSCSGAPTMSTCTVSPSSVSLFEESPVGATVTVTTTSPSLVSPMHFTLPSFPFALRTTWPVAALFLSMLVFFSRKRRLWTGLWVTTAGLALLVVGCGGGHHVPTGGTPTGTSELTVTGTSGTLTRSVTVPLTVK
jgi:beta-propeller repeat-containing protein